MTYVPIPHGEEDWDQPVNGAFVDQNNRIDSNAGAIVALNVTTGSLITQVNTNTNNITVSQADIGALQATKYDKTGGPLSGEISTDLPSRSAFFKTTSAAAHAVTIYQASTSGVDVAASLNVVSDNPQTSSMYLSGTENNRGTLKIAHRNPGPAVGSDSAASSLSIDIQQNGFGGTAAQGIFITSTDGGTTGNLITVRHNTRDDFVVKSTGNVGIKLPIAATPAGALDVRQGDNATVGLAMTAVAGGQQMVLLKDSGGNARFEVNAAGNTIFRANILSTAPMQMGSTTADLGGLTGSGFGIKNATAVPTTNPTGGGILYAEAGALKWRNPAGTVTTIAP